MDVSKCMRTKLVLAKPDCDYKSLLCKISDTVPRLAYIVDENYKLLGIVSAVDLLKEIVPSYGVRVSWSVTLTRIPNSLLHLSYNFFTSV
jgi:CBS-domain-containing membrane protein